MMAQGCSDSEEDDDFETAIEDNLLYRCESHRMMILTNQRSLLL